MKPAQSVRNLTALLLTALIGLSGCSLVTATPPPEKFEQSDHHGLKRFDQVSPDVFRGSQPDAEELKAIVAANHIKTVIKLNTGSDPVLPGVEVIRHPLNAWITPSAETIQEILQSIDKAVKPVYIHCSHGEDRTGLIVAIYKVCRLNVKPEDAYLDMVAHGFHPYRGVWNAWVREAGWKSGTDARHCQS